MSPRLPRRLLIDGSIIDVSIEAISPDEWRPHGVRYRFAWVQNGVARVIFDNHTGKKDHFHLDVPRQKSRSSEEFCENKKI